MTLSKFCAVLQEFCHQGYSLDEVVLKYNDSHLKLKDVNLFKSESSNECIIIDLEKDDEQKNVI